MGGYHGGGARSATVGQWSVAVIELVTKYYEILFNKAHVQRDDSSYSLFNLHFRHRLITKHINPSSEKSPDLTSSPKLSIPKEKSQSIP